MRVMQNVDYYPRAQPSIWLLALFSISLFFCGCKGATSPTTPPLPGSPVAPSVARQLTLLSGSGQSGTVGERLAEPFQVLVTDAAGQPMNGVDVFWKVTEGAGQVDAPLVIVDGEAGMVAVTTTAGNGVASAGFLPSVGHNRVRASTFFSVGEPTFEATGSS